MKTQELSNKRLSTIRKQSTETPTEESKPLLLLEEIEFENRKSPH